MEAIVSTVCIIDDDDIYQFVAQRDIEFTRLVKKVILFSSGEAALKFFKEEIHNSDVLPDIVFLDINMPIMDGWQFMEEYSIIRPNIIKSVTIYLVSSSVDERDIQRAKKMSEVSGYIIKPIGRDRLAEIFYSRSN